MDNILVYFAVEIRLCIEKSNSQYVSGHQYFHNL